MVVSNEPGYYEDGQFGIRIENLLVCPIVRRCMHNLMLSNDLIGHAMPQSSMSIAMLWRNTSHFGQA